ncbi:MAG TPA: glycoside hydrolase family 20 zincin-like fold domain-containing protein, partial [Ignavibacteriales bacterium]|nr:glycoside hydrolase family 20 zincin-like fold domain-containing protein [Ignavibacteriales bacterium]
MRPLLFLLFFLNISCDMDAQSLYDQIVPKPHSAKIEQGSFNLSKGAPVIKQQGAGIQPAVKLIQDAADAVTGANTEKSGLSIKINLGKLSFSGMPSFAKEEAYSLKISANEITVTAESPKGAYYAALTLVQLIEKSGGVLPCGEIQDWPDMQFRGISDDLSRGQVSTLPNFKKIIDFISRYKMNVYMPYLEDMVQLKSYPNIGKNRGALTPDEIKELVAYAKERYVEIIPIYQTLGHYENILAEYEFLKYAEFPGAASLNVS